MAEEKVDVFDENYHSLGVTTKTEARNKGLWVRAIHCWFIRPESPGYVLFQKRGADKKIYPNCLDITAAGHYKAGEKIEEGIREISEEIGLQVSFNDLIPLGIKLDVGKVGELLVHEFCHTYLFKCSNHPEDFDINEDEVEGLVEISIHDGLALFAGEKEKVPAKGVEFYKTTRSWEQISIETDSKQFIPRIDPYYYKIFINAMHLLRGEKYLAI